VRVRVQELTLMLKHFLLLFLFVNLPQVSALFLRELEFSPLPVLRNNLLIILTDICVRYTSLVDPHINKLALCLRDDNALVRQHALSLITHLLATDYVKWRGTLFFRYLVTLVLSSTLSLVSLSLSIPPGLSPVCLSRFQRRNFEQQRHDL
jgi:hypothetical protein